MTDPVDLAKLARAIETALDRTGSPERAAAEKRYLKSDMDFLGATLADIRRVTRQAARDLGLDRDGAVRLVEELWSAPTFERRMAAGAHPGAPRRRSAIRGPQADRATDPRVWDIGRWWTSSPATWLGRWHCTFASDARWIGGLATTTSGSDGRRC